MNSVLLSQSLFFRLPSCQLLPCPQRQPQCIVTNRLFHQTTYVSPLSLSFPFLSRHSLRACVSSVGATVTSNEGVVTEGVVSVINFEDFAEKDWSFLESDDFGSEQDKLKVDRIISTGEIQRNI
ncbi:hypothetical protein M0R45_009492 [Rubus argutus]|uniref:Uncharacterized protein n=1 Tax=Rubus argutus TaxID=59490 RepID=A0AAW1Y4W2_RUBAR